MRMRLKQARGAYCQIIFLRYVRHKACALNGRIIANPEMQRIAVIQQLKDCLNRVIAVRLTAGDMQKKVQFCGR